jgi:hypothetical protein
MSKPGWLISLQLWIVLTLILSACAVSNTYEGEEFSLSAPPGYNIKPQTTPYFDHLTHMQEVLYSSGSLYPYFMLYRIAIPAGSSLEGVLSDYKTAISINPSYKFISQTAITLNGRAAIELVHREFIGEPYVQTREVWVENNGWAYSLMCVTPTSAEPGAVIPVSERCIQIAQGFQFK